jgi:hypothetical protein
MRWFADGRDKNKPILGCENTAADLDVRDAACCLRHAARFRLGCHRIFLLAAARDFVDRRGIFRSLGLIHVQAAGTEVFGLGFNKKLVTSGRSTLREIRCIWA